MKSLKNTLLQKLEEPDEAGVRRQEAIALAIIDKAMAGDLHAAAFIRDLTDKNKETGEEQTRTVTVRVVK